MSGLSCRILDIFRMWLNKFQFDYIMFYFFSNFYVWGIFLNLDPDILLIFGSQNSYYH